MTTSYRIGAYLVLYCLCITASAVGQVPSDWQQRVHYEMDVKMLADRHQMRGDQTLRYVNHSPDTLSRVFYHLYFNAFQPHSMMAERNRHLPDPDSRIVPRIFNLNPEEIGYHRIESLTQDGTPVDFSIFDTVMEVDLAEPILPGAEAVFEMSFRSQVPLQTRRSGRDNQEGIDYSMSQWYPKMANYDERGWHADPYVGREFYSPFGTFDVRITLPSDYVIGATGVLQNPDAVGHGYAGMSPTSSPADADSLTWHFRAEDVHDFAWAADPDYLHDVLEMENGTKIHLLYQPDVADTWEELHEGAPDMLAFFEKEYGDYLYPQFTIAQAGDGGMEYPMMTFITGRRPTSSLLGVTAHEAAHMWFYGMIGSNEAHHAWMDEGFANYATTEVMAHLQDRPNPSHASSHLAVLQAKHFGLFERMNTRSDWFDTNFGYSIASYAGGQMLVDMLGYVISDSLRDRFFYAYHERFALRHADPYGVETVAEEVSGLRLDWFFEQYVHENWTLDYALDRLRSTRSGQGWQTRVTLRRKGRAAMPADVRLTLADGSVRWVHVPLSVAQGHKPVPDDWLVVEPWAWTVPTYTFEITTDRRVTSAEIDPLLRTPEATRLNNGSSLPIDLHFLQPPGQSWSRYQVGWRPAAGYAHNWGVGGGVQLRGRYLFNRFSTRATLYLWPQVLFSRGEDPAVEPLLPFADPFIQHSAADGIDFDVSIANTFLAGGLVTWRLRSRKHLGILQNDAGVSIVPDPVDLLTGRERRLAVGVRHQQRTSDRSLFNHASEGFLPASIVSAHARLSATSDRARYVLAGETGGELGARGTGRTANRVWADLGWGVPVGPFTASVRVLGGLGDGHLARHKRFRLGSSTFEDRWGNAAYRNVGGALEAPLDDAHWVAFSGPGPVAYLRRPSELTDGATGPIARSNVAAISARLLTPKHNGHRLLRPLRAELFFGAGQTWNGHWASDFDPEEVLADAGIGFRYDLSRLSGIDRWRNQSDLLSNLVLTARFPLWAGRPQQTDEPDPVAFRWLIGVQMDDLPWH
ncbi:MAG: M1 family metallopeptidase [Rhodothermales bacterium]